MSGLMEMLVQLLTGSAYHQAKQMFHTAKPERLIGRDKETDHVRSFLKGHMSKKTGGSLYISGAPGTGKTAVLTCIIDEMKVGWLTYCMGHQQSNCFIALIMA